VEGSCEHGIEPRVPLNARKFLSGCTLVGPEDGLSSVSKYVNVSS
jgi:hypothetical protein